jgi:hypothetical protein
MKRLALSISAATALAFGACEKHSAAELPEHYQHKGSHQPEAEAAHDEHTPSPAAEHKG